MMLAFYFQMVQKKINNVDMGVQNERDNDKTNIATDQKLVNLGGKNVEVPYLVLLLCKFELISE